VSGEQATSVSIVICALNEAENIVECLESLEEQVTDEILLVDGGSTDGTVDLALATNPAIRVLSLPNEGLLRQRLAGIAAVTTELVLLMDADDRLLPGSVRENVEMLVRLDLDGCQFTFNPDLRNRWTRAWSALLSTAHTPGDSVPMLGRPSVSRRSIYDLTRIDEAPLRVDDEDYYIAANNLRKGHSTRFIVGTGATMRLQPQTLAETLGKIGSYGRGDARAVQSLPDLFRVSRHLLVRYPIERGLRAVRLHGIRSYPIHPLIGIGRFVVMLRTLLIGSKG